MLSLEQTSIEFPLRYPFSENKIPLKERITVTDIPKYIISENMINDVFPDVRSKVAIYISGCKIENWIDLYECTYVYCCEFKIQNIFFIWSSDIYVRVIIREWNWRKFLQLPQNFNDILIKEYDLGSMISLNGISVRNLLQSQNKKGPFEMFVSPSGESSYALPRFGYDNIPAFDIIREKKLNVFAHATLNLNLAKDDMNEYITRVLLYCSGHKFKGVIFNVGTNKNIPFAEAKRKTMENIIIGINNAKFVEGSENCKFLLKTPSGKGSEMFTNIYDFISFCSELNLYPGVKNNFSICIDTCHVHQCGYVPYKYLTEVLKYLTVDLVHLNDSASNWGCRKEIYKNLGEGFIPWIYLMKVTQICKLMNIQIISS